MLVNKRNFLIILLGIYICLLFIEFPGSHLFDPDESRYAEIAREMLVNKNIIVPMLNGSDYLEKPPLLYWMNSAALLVFGENSYAARLPSRLATLGTVIIMLLFVWHSQTLITGLWSAIIFISSLLLFGLGRANITDTLLTCTLTLSFFSVWKFIQERMKCNHGGFYAVIAGFSMGLSVLAKGAIGVLFPVLVVCLWIVITRRWHILKDCIMSFMPVIFAVTAIPYFFVIEWLEPGFSQIYFIQEHLLRYTTTMHNRFGHWYYFIPVIIVGFLPWTGMLLRSLISNVLNIIHNAKIEYEELFLLLWVGVIFIFFSFSSSKLIPYVIPIFPAMSALLGIWIVKRANEPMQYLRLETGVVTLLMIGFCFFIVNSKIIREYDLILYCIGLGITITVGAWSMTLLREKNIGTISLIPAVVFLPLYLIILIKLPSISAYFSDAPLAEKIKALDVQSFYLFRYYSPSFSWVLKKDIPVINYKGELDTDDPTGSDLHLSEDKFWEQWNSGAHLVVCIQKQNLFLFQQNIQKQPHILTSYRSLVVLSNYELQ